MLENLEDHDFISEGDRHAVMAYEGDVMQEKVFCSISDYRHPDQLDEGDLVPDLKLVDLETAVPFPLSPPRSRPIVLLFGSYT